MPVRIFYIVSQFPKTVQLFLCSSNRIISVDSRLTDSIPSYPLFILFLVLTCLLIPRIENNLYHCQVLDIKVGVGREVSERNLHG